MNLLLFSASLLLIILLIQYFVGSKRNCVLKTLIIFGILIGLLSIGLNYLSDKAFVASTPVNIQTENLTDKKLKIYAITFWDNNLKETVNHVYYDTEIKPNEISNFWIENDGTKAFWIIAKDKNNEIEYLNVVTEKEREFDFRITETKNVKLNKAQTAKELIDKSEQMKKFAIWANVILIGLLILSLIKIKTSGNNVSR